MEFVALDVETANPDCSSICQIGLARYKDGLLADEWSTLVNPEDYFDPFNVSIHGITEEMAGEAPLFPDLIDDLRSRTAGVVVLSHTPFDQVALEQACMKYHLPELVCRWLDTARVARRAWSQFARRGYGLHNVCEVLGYDFRHHDALEDAKASAQVLLAAMNETGLDLEGWLERVQQRISEPVISRPGDPEGPLHGEVVVFTGSLAITRGEAAAMAAKAGCTVADSVTKHTTILVVGIQDEFKLAGYAKSSKHRKAEELIRKGSALRILTEDDFAKLVAIAGS
jgi:DNA polymerase-3 subunit epsilon